MATTTNITLVSQPDGTWSVRCGCGFSTPPRLTLEAAGREYDLHLAARWPRPSQRFPCPVALDGTDGQQSVAAADKTQ